MIGSILGGVRSPFTTFSRAKGDRSFSIKKSIALHHFFTRDGRSLFFASKGRDPFTTFYRATGDLYHRAGRSPFTTFLRATGDRTFGIVPVDRPLRLFHWRRAIALFDIKMSVAQHKVVKQHFEQTERLITGNYY